VAAVVVMLQQQELAQVVLVGQVW